MFGFCKQVLVIDKSDLDQFPHSLFEIFYVFQQADIFKFFPNNVFARMAQHLHHSRININYVPGLFIYQQQAVFCGFEHPPEAFLIIL